MPDELVVRTEIDGDKLVLFNNGGTEYIGIGPEMCFCCAECCQDIQGGVFNGSGQLVFETNVLTITITMPTPDSRTVCHGDIITMVAEYKPAYYSGSAAFWHIWLDRDWLHQSHTADTELHEGAHWFIWETNLPTTTVVLKWTSCWLDYVTQYGDIRFGTEVGEPAEEFVDITCLEHPLPPSVECCVYASQCVDCEFLFPWISDDIGPEVTDDGPTYWFEGDWSMQVILTGPDVTTKTLAREETASLSVGIRPPKDHYLSYLTTSEVCFEHPEWKNATGVQFYPQNPSLPDALPAIACFPSSFSEDLGTCPQILRFENPTPALLFDLGADIQPCFDNDCGDLENPGTLTVTVVVTSEDPDVTIVGAISPTACSLPEDCCDCVFAVVYEFQMEFVTQPATPPPDLTAWFAGYPGEVVQLGVSLEDCTTHSGKYILTYFIAMCSTIEFQTQVATEICEAMTIEFGEACVYNLFAGGPISFVTAKASLDTVCNQTYDTPPDPGNCDAMIYCVIKTLEEVDAICCGSST